MVAVAEKSEGTASTTARQPRPRTPDQRYLLGQHRTLVREMYGARDPDLARVLSDQTVLWTEDLVQMFGLTDQRVHVLYSAGRDLFDNGWLIHPDGIPVSDTDGGQRGKFAIRGITFGRLALWALGAHRAIWNPETKKLTFIKSGDAEPVVARAKAALTSGKVPEHYHEVLHARVRYPNHSNAEIAKLLGVSKATFTSKLRRALVAADNA